MKMAIYRDKKGKETDMKLGKKKVGGGKHKKGKEKQRRRGMRER